MAHRNINPRNVSLAEGPQEPIDECLDWLEIPCDPPTARKITEAVQSIRAKGHFVPVDEESLDILNPGNVSPIEAEAIRNEMFRFIHANLCHLNSKQRAVISRKLQGLSEDEVAQDLNLSKSLVVEIQQTALARYQYLLKPRVH